MHRKGPGVPPRGTTQGTRNGPLYPSQTFSLKNRTGPNQKAPLQKRPLQKGPLREEPLQEGHLPEGPLQEGPFKKELQRGDSTPLLSHTL